MCSWSSLSGHLQSPSPGSGNWRNAAPVWAHLGPLLKHQVNIVNAYISFVLMWNSCSLMCFENILSIGKDNSLYIVVDGSDLLFYLFVQQVQASAQLQPGTVSSFQSFCNTQKIKTSGHFNRFRIQLFDERNPIRHNQCIYDFFVCYRNFVTVCIVYVVNILKRNISKNHLLQREELN